MRSLQVWPYGLDFVRGKHALPPADDPNRFEITCAFEHLFAPLGPLEARAHKAHRQGCARWAPPSVSYALQFGATNIEGRLVKQASKDGVKHAEAFLGAAQFPTRSIHKVRFEQRPKRPDTIASSLGALAGSTTFTCRVRALPN
jgi:hypothetical protein